MRNHVTVVPRDKLILVEGQGLVFDYSAPQNMHALQWHDGHGHIEWTDDYPHPLTPSDYDADVAPFVQAWEADMTRLAAEAEQARQEAEELYNSFEERAKRVRTERDARITATDYLMAVDYPLNDDARATVAAYRQSLRDLPQAEGFPWDGGVLATPWPSAPTV